MLQQKLTILFPLALAHSLKYFKKFSFVNFVDKTLITAGCFRQRERGAPAYACTMSKCANMNTYYEFVLTDDSKNLFFWFAANVPRKEVMRRKIPATRMTIRAEKKNCYNQGRN